MNKLLVALLVSATVLSASNLNAKGFNLVDEAKKVEDAQTAATKKWEDKKAANEKAKAEKKAAAEAKKAEREKALSDTKNSLKNLKNSLTAE